jgi:hypothetical protein
MNMSKSVNVKELLMVTSQSRAWLSPIHPKNDCNSASDGMKREVSSPQQWDWSRRPGVEEEEITTRPKVVTGERTWRRTALNQRGSWNPSRGGGGAHAWNSHGGVARAAGGEHEGTVEDRWERSCARGGRRRWGRRRTGAGDDGGFDLG